MEFKFPLFFNTLETKPVRNTDDYFRLVDEEVYKLENGVIIDGVQISGWLYWHLNHWYIRIDKKEDNGNVTRITSLPYLRDNEWIRAEAMELCRLQQKGYMEVGLRQGGKALHNSSILYTKDSEITIGDCKVGDQIYDDQGNLTTITNKFPQGIRPVYKMTLVDGREILCDLNHKWKVYNRLSKKHEIKNTEELCIDYKKIRKDWEGVRKNPYEFKYSIPCNNAVKYEEKNLPIDPYFLGLWLGDGSNTYSKITSVDDEIINYLYNYSKSIGLQITPDSFYTHMITSGVQGGDKNLFDKKNIVHQYLKKLYNNKHIPKEYFYSSVEQRMELLRGLMDSDGSCDKRGKIEFSSAIPKLADDFYKLCRSLGINLSKTIKKTSYKKNNIKINCKDTTRFILYTNKPVFKLSRKLERICQTPKYLNNTAILNIEYLYDDYTTCITVDNESHLFLTDNYTITHNSELEASFLAYNATLFKNTQNVIVGGNSDDLVLLKDKVDFGLKHLWEGIAIPRLDKTWKTSSVRLGYKLTSGEDDIWSTIIIRNAADGNNTETAAGTTAKSYIMDEVGKYKFSKVFEAAKPALNSEFGWRAIPILVGTGGAFEKGEDAERFFYHPDANNFLGFVDPESGKKTCLFMSGLYRQDSKKDYTLGQFLRDEGREIPDDSYLFSLFMKVADKEEALRKITKEREDKKQDPDQQEYLKVIMYHPLTPEECFLSVSDNIFNRNIAKSQQRFLYDNNITGSYVSLEHDGESIKHTFVNKKPVSNFPHKHSDDTDAPVQIWEMPISNAPYGLYTAGVDSYRQANSADSSSLGAVYIFKRVHNIHDEKYQNMFVASYVARPEDKNKWNETARNLIKFYNARTLVENDEASFIDYMISKGDEHYLEPEPQYLKGLVANSRVVGRRYGIHRSAAVIMNHLHTTFKSYMEEVISTQRDKETGAIIKEVLGCSQILDPMLLEEVIKFNPDINVDRIVAAELALSLGLYLNRSIGTLSSTNEDARLQSYMNNKKTKSVFSNNSTIFTKRKSLFR